jgi:hypothetical protein
MVMSTELKDAAAAIEAALSIKRAEVAQLEQALATVRGLGSVLSNQAGLPSTHEFQHMGIMEASRQLFAEDGAPKSTRQLADAMLARGLRTRSRNFVATVYATLANAPKEFQRNEAGEWFRVPKE